MVARILTALENAATCLVIFGACALVCFTAFVLACAFFETVLAHV